MVVLVSAVASNLNIGAVHIQVSSSSVGMHCSFGHMALISGIVSCCTPTLLAQLVPDSTVFATWLYEEIISLCSVTQFQYHSFRVLLQWFKKSSRSPNAIAAASTESVYFLATGDSSISQTTMRLIWTHLDSPVDGVNDIVMDIFKSLLSAMREEEVVLSESCLEASIKQQAPNDSFEAFLQQTLDAALQLSWHIKGKHRLLAALVAYLDVEQVIIFTF